MFLTMLAALERSGRNVSDKRSPSYAPSVFAKECEVNIGKDLFEDAMARLFTAQRIRVETTGPPSKQRSKIVAVGPS
jgi:hypothetical protein